VLIKEKFNQGYCVQQKTCDRLQGFASEKLKKARNEKTTFLKLNSCFYKKA
jgi:hypothetical protein